MIYPETMKKIGIWNEKMKEIGIWNEKPKRKLEDVARTLCPITTHIMAIPFIKSKNSILSDDVVFLIGTTFFRTETILDYSFLSREFRLFVDVVGIG